MGERDTTGGTSRHPSLCLLLLIMSHHAKGAHVPARVTPQVVPAATLLVEVRLLPAFNRRRGEGHP